MLVSGTSGVSAQEPTATPTEYWHSIWDTPTPLPSREYACCEGTPEGWGLCTPAAAWLMNCAQCAPVPTSGLFPAYTEIPSLTPWPTATPFPSVTSWPTVTVTYPPTATVTVVTPTPTPEPTAGAPFVRWTGGNIYDGYGVGGVCGVSDLELCLWWEYTAPHNPNQVWTHCTTHADSDGGVDTITISACPAGGASGYPKDTVNDHWNTPVMCSQQPSVEWEEGGCVKWSWDFMGDYGWSCLNPWLAFNSLRAEQWGNDLFHHREWVFRIEQVNGVSYLSTPTPTPSSTITPTATVTPTVTPTAVSGTYCCTVACEDPGGSDPWEMLPTIQVGIGDCVTIQPYDLSVIGLGQFPGIEVCAVPLRFGEVNILGVTLSIDVLATVAAALVALRIAWRS